MTYLPFVSIIVAVLGLAATYFGFVTKMREDISSMQVDLAKLNAADDVFWRILGPRLGEIIHSPIHKRRDQLMDEWLAAPKGSIPEADLRELRDELEQMLDEADAGNAVGVRLVGAMLLSRVEVQIGVLEKAQLQSKGA